MDVTIDIGKDYTKYPGGRYVSKGPFSGEDFREKHLIPALQKANGGSVKLILDGAIGYSSSFLEEAFGGLIRKGYSKDDIISHLIFDSNTSVLIEEIMSYIDSAEKDLTSPLH